MAISRYEDMEGRLLNLGIGANFDPSQVQAERREGAFRFLYG